MTANVALYLPTVISVEMLQRIAGDATVSAKRNPPLIGRLQYQVQWPELTFTLTVMPDNERVQHLSGLAGYIVQALAHNDPKSALDRVQAVQSVLGGVIEPGWDTLGRCKQVVLSIVEDTNGFFFAGNALYDQRGELIIGPPNSRRKFFLEEPNVTEESLARKARSEAILQREGVPYIPHLPGITSSVDLRSKEEVARRAMTLCLVAVRAEGIPQEQFTGLLTQYGLEAELTPAERAFVNSPSPTEQEVVNFTWRYESYSALLWALSYVEHLSPPEKICDVPHVVTILRDRTAEQFIEQAHMRSLTEILDQADLIYRYHWAVTDARLKGQASVAGLNPGVVYERHYALNWLIRHEDAEWDDVSTPT